MTHIDENTLELFVLGDKKVRRREKQIKRHLAECRGCSGLYQDIKSFYAEVEREGESAVPPLSRMTERSLVRKRNELEPYFASAETEVTSYSEVRVPSVWRRIDRFRREHPVRSTLAMFTFAAVLALAGSYLWKKAVINSNPAYIHLNTQKGMVEVFNSDNRLLWSIPGSNLQFIEHNIVDNATSYWQISDLNSDGKTEVVSILPGLGSVPADIPVLQIFGPSGRLLRQTNLSPGVISFAGRQYNEPFLNLNVLVAGISTHSRHKEIFVGTTDGHSPYCVVRLNSQGKILGTYWHFGFLVGMSMVRLADGKEYLALCGENDVQDRSRSSFPVIVMVDPSKIVGRTESVVTPGFGFSPSKAEVYYVRLPNSDMNYALHAYMAVKGLVGRSNGQLSFNLESELSSMAKDGTPTFGVTFSKRMRVISYDATNASVTMHGELKNQGLVKGNIDSAYLDNLKDEVRYWNGREWVKKAARIEQYPDGASSKELIPGTGNRQE